MWYHFYRYGLPFYGDTPAVFPASWERRAFGLSGRTRPA